MNNRFELGVRAIIKNSEGKILLVRNHHGLHKNKLVLPGGRVEFKESANEAIVREVKEEVGLDLTLIKFVSYNEDLISRDDKHFIALYFEGTAKGEIKPQDSEVVEVKYLSRDEIEKSTDIATRHKNIVLNQQN